MNQSNPRGTFRGLPLSAEQEAEIQHYINRQKRRGLPYETPELQAMLADMLNPPCLEGSEPDTDIDTDNFRTNSERAASTTDEGTDLISSAEERNAIFESEAMKHPQR